MLFVDKKNKVLKISPLKNLLMDTDKLTDEVTRFNDNHLVSLNRKALKEKAASIKEEWVTEVEEELKRVKDIIIVNKY